MTTVRCPSCDASVPADAAWCTLCFAQLGAQPPAAPAPVEPAPLPTLEPEPVFSAPAFSAPAPAAPVLSAPVLSAPVPTQTAVAAAPTATAVVEPAAAPTWPCSGCDERVALDETVCPSCGTPFMGGVNPNVSLKVPGVGDLVTMSTGMKVAVIAGGGTVVALVLVLLFLVLGHIF